MRRRHGPRHDSSPTAREPTSLHQVKALAKFQKKPWRLEKVVAIVSVRHDDKLASGCANPPHKGIAVAAFRHRLHPRTAAPRDVLRPVGAPIVGNNHFAADTMRFERPRALRTHVSSVSASFRQGITIDSSILSASLAFGNLSAVELPDESVCTLVPVNQLDLTILIGSVDPHS